MGSTWFRIPLALSNVLAALRTLQLSLGRTDTPAKTTNVKFTITVGGEIYGARGSSLYLMTGTRDITTCAGIVYGKHIRTHLSQISLVSA